MIFYIATGEDGMRHVCTTQAEAKPIDKDFVQLDIPVDKSGLRDTIQELLSLIDQNGSTETEQVGSTLPEPQIELQPASAPAGRPAVDMTTLNREERKKLCYPRNVDLLDREYFEQVWSHMPMPLKLDLISSAMGHFRQYWIQQTKASQPDEQAPEASS